MNKNLVCIIALLWCMGMHAQQLQVVATSGNYVSNSSGSICWTLGEPVTECFSASNSVLLQGFQQTYRIISSVEETNDLPFVISVFPNPFKDKICLTTENPAGLQYSLYDITGNMVCDGIIETTNTIIDVEELPLSVYFMKIMKGTAELKTLKLVKL